MNLLKVNSRDLSTNVKDMRTSGVVPGVLYGPSIEHQLIEIPRRELLKYLDLSGEVYEIKTNDSKSYVKFQEIQRNPVKNDILHFSLVELPKGVKSDIEVPVHISGECRGVKDGGVLVTMKDSLVVTSAPSQMPESVEVDITNLLIGEKITVGDLEKSQKIEVVGDKDEAVVMCQAVSLDTEIDNEEGAVEVAEGTEAKAEGATEEAAKTEEK